MQGNETVKQSARWVALGALFLIPLTPLVVANGFFFPFITGKAFYLRVLIEIAVFAWILLTLFDTEYRPRFSWVGAIVVVFVAWMFVADAFALNAGKAFWSNFERMEGWVLLAHLLGFFFASSSVLRAERKWRAWFFTSICVSIMICGYALLQLTGTFAIHQGSTRLDATLGNSAYLAVYLLFSVFVSLWLAFTDNRPWLKWSLIGLAALQGLLILFTETRGTVIGLVSALALASLLTVITAGRYARRIAAFCFVGIVVVVGCLYLGRQSAFIQDNHTLQRITSISVHDGQTRFTLWGMAFEGVVENPLIGWGQEGFNYVFNKYYKPSLFKQEQWFDRAHNAFIDWLIAGGVPAFLLYISLFGSALFTLWRHTGLARPERVMLTAVLVGYAIHNFFVFDNTYSYLYFFAILALIDSQTVAVAPKHRRAHIGEDAFLALPIVSVVALVVMYTVNVPGVRVASRLIDALSPQAGGMTQNAGIFTDLAASPSFAAQEVREQLVSFSSQAVQMKEVPDEIKLQIATLALSEMKKEVALHPQDARAHLQLSLMYRTFGNVDEVLKEIDAAIALSPKKLQFFIQKGVTQLEVGRFADASKTLDEAYKIGPQFSEIAKYAALGRIAVGNEAGAKEILIAHPEVVEEVEAIIKQLSAPRAQ